LLSESGFADFVRMAIRAKPMPNSQNRKFVNSWEKNADVETVEVEKVKYLTSRHR